MSEPPSPDGRKSRSDAAARLAALLADVGDAAPAPPEPAPPRAARRARPPVPDVPVEEGGGEATVRYDLRSLDRLLDGGEVDDEVPVVPDLTVFDEPAPELEPEPEPEPESLEPEPPEQESEPELPDPRSEEPEGLDLFDEPDDAPPAGPEPVAVPAEGRRRRFTLRAVAFGAALVILVAAIPALGVLGARRLSDSRGGNVTQGELDPDEPGYLALVVPTRTALLVHRAPDGNLASATLLALNAGDTGGTVLQVPLNTQMRNPRYLMVRIVQTFEYEGDIEFFYREVEDRLGVAIHERVDLTDGQIAELVRPVAPLAINNPDNVVLDDGRTISSGPVELAAEDVGPFLRGNGGVESELALLARNEMVWDTWLRALGGVGNGAVDAVTTATSLSPFLQSLAAGAAEGVDTTRVETLDVGPQPDSEEPTLVPEEGFDAQVNTAVPYPQSPGPGRRYALKLLNGVDGNVDLPRAMLHDLVTGGAALTQLGNGHEFGQERSTIEIVSDAWRPQAEVAKFLLGGEAVISEMTSLRADDVDVDMVITVGRDALAVYEERGGG